MERLNYRISDDELSAILVNIGNLELITPEVSKAFFDRFGISDILISGYYFEALRTADILLHTCHRLNPDVYNRLHKGGVYYWMGMASFLLKNYQLATFYMDAAVSEDIKNNPDELNTPARLFLRLEGSIRHQAAQDLTIEAETRIFYYVSMYNKISCSSNSGFKAVGMKNIRTSLLEKAANSNDPQFRSLATLFISFFLEFSFLYTQLMLRNEPGTNEPFFSHLFRGGLLFESLIRNNPKINVTGNSLNGILDDLGNDLGFPDGLNFKGKKDFEKLNEQLESDSDNLRDAIQDVSTIRNVFGHDIAWNQQLEHQKYCRGFDSIALSCIHVISMLYR